MATNELVEEGRSPTVEELGLRAKVYRVLQGAGIATVGDLSEKLAEGDEALLAIRGFGPRSLTEVKAKLNEEPIEVLDLSRKVRNLLVRAGIATVEGLLEKLAEGDEALLAIRGFGRRSLAEVKERLQVKRFLPLEVQLLRQRLYTRPDPSQHFELEEALRKALEKERKTALGWKQLPQRQDVLLPTASGACIDARVLLRMSHVPTGIVHCLNPEHDPLVTFVVKSTRHQSVKLRLTSEVARFSDEFTDEVTLDGDESVTKHQLPTFVSAECASVTALTKAALHVTIDLVHDGTSQTLHKRTFHIFLLARTTALRAVRDPVTGTWKDLRHFYGVFVTPNASSVQAFLPEVVERHGLERTVGYGGGVYAVRRQVEAVFEALKSRGIRYCYSVISFAPTGLATQRVRLPGESLQYNLFNCIDGTVLFASLLEAISLNPAIVLIPPRHAIVAWETQAENNHWEYVDTTMIPRMSFPDAFDKTQSWVGNILTKSQKWSLRDLRQSGITEMPFAP